MNPSKIFSLFYFLVVAVGRRTLLSSLGFTWYWFVKVVFFFMIHSLMQPFLNVGLSLSQTKLLYIFKIKNVFGIWKYKFWFDLEGMVEFQENSGKVSDLVKGFSKIKRNHGSVSVRSCFILAEVIRRS